MAPIRRFNRNYIIIIIIGGLPVQEQETYNTIWSQKDKRGI